MGYPACLFVNRETYANPYKAMDGRGQSSLAPSPSTSSSALTGSFSPRDLSHSTDVPLSLCLASPPPSSSSEGALPGRITNAPSLLLDLAHPHGHVQDPDEKFLFELKDRLSEDEFKEEEKDEILDTLLEIISEKQEGSSACKLAVEWYATLRYAL